MPTKTYIKKAWNESLPLKGLYQYLLKLQFSNACFRLRIFLLGYNSNVDSTKTFPSLLFENLFANAWTSFISGQNHAASSASREKGLTTAHAPLANSNSDPKADSL